MRALPRRFAPALVALTLANPALADLTAPQLWALWQDAGNTAGQRLTPSRESLAGNTLSLFDVAMVRDIEQGHVSATIPRIDMTDQGDGTVAVTLSPRHDLRLHLTDGTGETLDATLGVDMPGLRIIASGDAGRQSYAVTAPQIGLTLHEATIGDAPVDAQISLTLRDLSGRIGVAGGPEGRFTSHLSADSVAFDAQGQMPGEPDSAMTLTGTYGPVSANMTRAARTTSTLSHGAGKLTLSVDQPGFVPFEWTSTSAAGRLTSALHDGMLDQSGRIDDATFSVKGSVLPLDEIKARMQAAAWSVHLPATTSATPGDLALRLDIDGVTLDPELWATFDPDATLPQEAASLHLDISGKGRLVDEPFSLRGDVQPWMLHSLKLNALRLSAAGTALSGTGALRFDPSAPAPDGTLHLSLTGSGALLAKLVRHGLVPRTQAMGARLILGLFTVPTGEDALGTTLTFTPDGKISANGQRVQ